VRVFNLLVLQLQVMEGGSDLQRVGVWSVGGYPERRQQGVGDCGRAPAAAQVCPVRRLPVAVREQLLSPGHCRGGLPYTSKQLRK
jgi:hypothetical protein